MILQILTITLLTTGSNGWYTQDDFMNDVMDPGNTYASALKKWIMVNSGKGGQQNENQCKDESCKDCLQSCNYLKYTIGINKYIFTQFLYLTICSEGCKKTVSCLAQSYCLPVMQENPDFFILCANNCPIMDVITEVFVRQ